MKKTILKLIVVLAFSLIAIQAVGFADNFQSPIPPKPDYLPGPDETILKDDASGTFRKTLITATLPRFAVILTGIVGIAAFLFLIISGIRFATAYTNEEAYEGAKKQAIYALVGFLIALLAYTVVNIIINIDFANGP